VSLDDEFNTERPLTFLSPNKTHHLTNTSKTWMCLEEETRNELLIKLEHPNSDMPL